MKHYGLGTPHSIGDLLWHLPSRFDELLKFVPLRRLVPNASQTAVATLGRISQRRTATGKLMTEAELAEEDGTPTDVRATWFGRAFVKETHREGERVRISGKVRFFGRTLQFSQPTLERADAEAVHTGGSFPIYPLTEGHQARSDANAGCTRRSRAARAARVWS